MHPVVWYRRVVRIDPVGTGRRVLLHFGAVDYRAEVWVNGQLVTRHEGGHTPFHADITDALGEGGEQVVVVRAEDPTDDPAQPRGKQDWRPAPHDIWYHRTTGIWQPVWLEVVGDRYLTRLDWTPDLVRGQVTLEAELSGLPVEGTRLEVRLTRPDRVVAEASVRVGTTTAVLRPRRSREARHGQDQGDLLWTPEHPTLLDARVTLRRAGRDGARRGHRPTSGTAASASATAGSSSTDGPTTCGSSSSRATGRSRTSPLPTTTRSVQRSKR